MGEWKEYKLGDLTNRKIGYGIVQPGDSVKNGVPVIKVNNLISGLRKIEELDTTSAENDKKYYRTKLLGGELIISVVGTIGKTAIVPKSFKGCNLVRATALIDIPDFNLALWVKYYIDSPKGQHYIKENLNTTVQPTLNIKSLVDMPIPMYSPEYRNRVVSILSSLDDKIEVNRRINENLEQQAQALFEDTIMNSKFPRTKVLNDYAFINPPRSISKGTTARYIDMSSLPTKGSFPTSWEQKEYNGGMKFQNGDTIMARITPCLENGKTAYINFLDNDEIAFGSTEYIVLSAHSDFCSELLYFLARYDDFVAYAVSHMNGSSGRQRVSGNDIANYIMPEIPKENIVTFEKRAQVIMEIIRNNSLESRHLAELRDTLLPRLMSGKLKVNEIEI